MSLFKCSKCGCIENTAVSHYWVRKVDKEPPLCSECDPGIGKWHNIFPKQSADAMGMVDDGDGYLITKEEAAVRKAFKTYVAGIISIKHIGPEGIAKVFFESGWREGHLWMNMQISQMKCQNPVSTMSMDGEEVPLGMETMDCDKCPPCLARKEIADRLAQEAKIRKPG